MQVRPAAPQNPNKPHPPTRPQIPIQSVQSLIPRLSIAIRDIDILRDQIASGATDGSLPNWDTLLQRYSLLLGRINTLSQYISQAPPPPKHTTPSIRPIPAPTYPALSRYLVHPLHPLSSSSEDLNPLAPDTFFQVLNTQQIPSIAESNAGLLRNEDSIEQSTLSASALVSGSGVGSGSESGSMSQPQAPQPQPRAPKMTRMEELNRMDERSLKVLESSLRDRLERDSRKAKALKNEIKVKEEEVDWTMRIEDGDEDDEDDEEGGDEIEVVGIKKDDKSGKESQLETKMKTESNQESKGDQKRDDEDEDDDDDLFGDNDDDGDDHMSGKPGGTDTALETEKSTEDAKKSIPNPNPNPNPRSHWLLADYISYMDTGIEPPPRSFTGL